MTKKLELTQTVLDPVTGEVLHQPGKVVSPGDALVALVGSSAFREVDVDEPKSEPKPEPKPKPEPAKKADH